MGINKNWKYYIGRILEPILFEHLYLLYLIKFGYKKINLQIANNLVYFKELKSNNNLDDFDPEELALQTISNSIDYYSRGIRNSNYPIVMPIDYIIKILKDIGFKILGFGEDGTNSISGTNVKSFSFFPPKYEGLRILVEKRKRT